MADTINGVPIGDLPGIGSVPDDSMLVVEFLGKAYSMPGAVLRQMIQDVLDTMGGSVDDVTEARLTDAIETVLAKGKHNGVSPIVEVLDEEDGTSVIHVIDAFGVKKYPVEVKGARNAVQYVPQELTEPQKAQARENIGAVSEADLPVIVKISGGFLDEFTVLLDGLPVTSSALNELVRNGSIVVGVVDDHATFMHLDETPYRLPHGTIFRYLNGAFLCKHGASLDNKEYVLKYENGIWDGDVFVDQYTFYLSADYPGRVVECDGTSLLPDRAYGLLEDAIANNRNIFCYQKDAVFELEDGSEYTPHQSVPFYYDHNTHSFSCENDGYECTLTVDMFGYTATARKTTPYKTAESKADGMEVEDGSLFLLSAGEPLGEGVPIPTGDSNVFVADYDTTTYAEIKTAHDAGKLCFVKSDGMPFCPLLGITDSEAIFIREINENTDYKITFTSSGGKEFTLVDKNTPLIVTLSGNDTDGYTADKTVADINAARNAGRDIYMVGGVVTYQLSYLSSSFAAFSYTMASRSAIEIISVIMMSGVAPTRIHQTIDNSYVKYTEQSLDEEYKRQARTNIGAASAEDVEQHGEKLAGTNLAYGTCETAAATAEKVVTVNGNDHWELGVGSVIMVYFTTSNTASNVTLNVNGTGAYPIWYNNAEYTSAGTAYTGYAKRVIKYMFNGTHWVWIGSSYDANTTYKNVSLGQGYATCATAATTTAKVGTLSGYTLTLGGIVAVKFTYAVPAGATLNINSKGAKKMFYRGAAIKAGVIQAGDLATFIYDGTQYQLLAVDRWQTEAITPQMFGAVGDGVADDTAAVQAALDHGGLIFFPAGRYKVTSLLTASKSCRIEMFKQYPSCWMSGNKGYYPLTADDNWMGSRIESYSPDGGIVVGASTEVDGLYMRAMPGFAGILFKFDERIGLWNYPATVRLSHIRLDIEDNYTIPEVMFDFVPKGSYRYFLDDINIGRRHVEFCEYGFRADLSQVSDSNWANNVSIRGLCVDLFADYPLYVDGAHRAAPWLFEGLAIQTYPYDTVISNGYGNGRTAHADIVTLKNLQETTFLSCYLWDLYQADYGRVFVTENVTNTSCIGCSSEFNQIENALSKQLAYAKNFTVKNLGVDIVVDPETNDSQLTLSDPAGNIQRVTLPGANLSDEQVEAGVGKWMDENSVPYEVVGKNKVDVTSEDFIINKIVVAGGGLSTANNMAVTNYIEAKYKDIIRMSKAGVNVSGYSMVCYDADKNFLANYDIRPNNPHGITPQKIEVLTDGTAYVRLNMTSNTCGDLATLPTNQFCVTVNNADVSYEPYGVSIEGGLGELIILQAPNGSRYTVSVNDSGLLIADPLNGGEAVTPGSTLTDADKAAITADVLAGLTSEDWVFTLEDGSTLTKKVVLK